MRRAVCCLNQRRMGAMFSASTEMVASGSNQIPALVEEFAGDLDVMRPFIIHLVQYFIRRVPSG